MARHRDEGSSSGYRPSPDSYSRGNSSRREREQPDGRGSGSGSGYGRERREYRDSPRLREREREDDKYGSKRAREYTAEDRERERARDRARYRDGGRSRSRSPRRNKEKDGDGDGRRRRSRSRSRSRGGDIDKDEEDPNKGKPNFGASGLLAADTKKVVHDDGTSTVLKYHEPPEARKPTVGWRLYVFKGPEQVELLHIQRQSAYLFGRDRAVVDIPLEHPSSSKQHAVIQYRHIQEKNEFGEVKAATKPFIIDLESTNGTHVNDEQIPAARYYELKVNDVVKFGLSTREYVLLHDEAS